MSNSDDVWVVAKNMVIEDQFSCSVLTHFNECNSGNVTFGDVNQSQTRGKCSVEIKGLLELQEVLYIKDLKANLFSISQICDDNHIVQFSKECPMSLGKMVI